MIQMLENEIDISGMTGHDDSNVQPFDFIVIGEDVVVVHKRFNNAVTSPAMIEAVTSATMIPTKAAIDPRPRTSRTLRVVRRPTRSISKVP